MHEQSSIERHPGGGGSWSGDAGARRLFALVRDACVEGADLPVRLEAGLQATFGMLAADPELAYELTVEPYLGGDEAALQALGGWVGHFGALLRDAAAVDPRAAAEPFFLAPFLIGGVRFQIGRLALNGEAADLPRLLPSLLEGVLSYYFEPGGPRALARVLDG